MNLSQDIRKPTTYFNCHTFNLGRQNVQPYIEEHQRFIDSIWEDVYTIQDKDIRRVMLFRLNTLDPRDAWERKSFADDINFISNREQFKARGIDSSQINDLMAQNGISIRIKSLSKYTSLKINERFSAGKAVHLLGIPLRYDFDNDAVVISKDT